MKKIAVICALPPERNTGMLTVDLAAHVTISKLVAPNIVQFYTYGKLSEYSYPEADIPFKYLDLIDHSEEYFSSDVFLFWGDFLHSLSYLEKDRGSWNKSLTRESQTSFQSDYYRHIFLSQLDQTRISRAIVFGSTIITNRAEDGLDETYRLSSERLFKSAAGVFFRDALSAAKVSPLRGEDPSLACDCALLLNDEDLNQFTGFEMAERREGVGVYFGRTKSKFLMLVYAKLLAAQLGESTRWIPWFFSRRKVRLLAGSFGYDVPDHHIDPGKILSDLSGCKFVITDTYHVCVNAWRLGIPAICIGLGAATSDNSLSDKKKEILFEMYGARSFYIFAEQLYSISGFKTALKQAKTALGDPRIGLQVRKNITQHVEAAVSRLRRALAEACG